MRGKSSAMIRCTCFRISARFSLSIVSPACCIRKAGFRVLVAIIVLSVRRERVRRRRACLAAVRGLRARPIRPSGSRPPVGVLRRESTNWCCWSRRLSRRSLAVVRLLSVERCASRPEVVVKEIVGSTPSASASRTSRRARFGSKSYFFQAGV